MAVWPGSLPTSLDIDTYAEAQIDGTVRTQMDAGPAFVRRRFSSVPTNVSGSMVMSETQFTTVMAFYNTTLNGGVDSFDWHPRGLHQASPQVVLNVRFLAPPARRVVGDVSDRGYQVDLAFEILP